MTTFSFAEPIVLSGEARTPIGAFGKSLATIPTHQLGAIAIRAAVERAGLTVADVDEVVLGCVGQVGAEAYNARLAGLAAGLPPKSTAVNVNRLCGSGLEAILAAATQLAAHQADIVVAGGNESMSGQPFLDYAARGGFKLADRTVLDGTLSLVTDPWGRYAMGVTAENVAQRYRVGRIEQDAFADQSQKRAVTAIELGRFTEQIVPVEVAGRDGTTTVYTDESPRSQTSVESLASLRPVFRSGGSVTAGNSSGISDGAAAVLMMRGSDAERSGVQARAVLVAATKSGVEPDVMGYAPTYAIRELLEHTGLSPADIGVTELNEAFAAQAVAVLRDTELDPDSTNPNGGAIALGHPVGATGAILTVKCVAEMHRTGSRFGLVSMCIGGGQALAALFELPLL